MLTAAALIASATVTIDCGAANIFTLTPGQDETINTFGIVAGKVYWLVILTSGVTSRILTFGTGFKSSGTLTTGTVSGRYFVMSFIAADTSNLIELSRTAAL